MANPGERPKPKSWASGLRLVSRESGSSGTTQETPKSSNPSGEKEFRFLMGQSFMGGGLDGLMSEASHSRKREANDDQSQAEVDNMLSSILKKTKTDLKHANPSFLDSDSEPPKNPIQTPNVIQNNPYYPNVNAYPSSVVNMPPPPPFVDLTQPPPFMDMSRPPPNFMNPPPYINQSSLSTSTLVTNDAGAGVSKKIERKWGNILKASTPTSPASNEDYSPSPIVSDAATTPVSTSVDSPWISKDPIESHVSKPSTSASSVTDDSNIRESLSSEEGSSSSLGPKLNKNGFKDIMSYDVDPIDMTYCGKEFIDIVDLRPSHTYSPHTTSEAVCHLCQLNHLPTEELALHLEGERHNKNLRNFILEKEYDFYNRNMTDPLHVAKYPDFKTYMLQRYPTRLEEYFKKVDVFDPVSKKRRSEFQLKTKPAKMLLAETMKTMENSKPQKKPKNDKFAPIKAISPYCGECPYCGDMIYNNQITSHTCAAEKASEEASTRRCGVPSSFVRAEMLGTKGSEPVPPPKDFMPPTDAADVQLKIEMCEEYKRFSQCQYGRKCMFAHSSTELNSMTYRRTKSEMCQNVGLCLELCGKAHSLDELTVCAKTVLCRSYIEMSSCQYKDKCQFAHGVQELLSPWDSRPLSFGGSKKETTNNKQLLPLSAQTPKGESQKQNKSKIKLTLKK